MVMFGVTIINAFIRFTFNSFPSLSREFGIEVLETELARLLSFFLQMIKGDHSFCLCICVPYSSFSILFVLLFATSLFFLLLQG